MKRTHWVRTAWNRHTPIAAAGMLLAGCLFSGAFLASPSSAKTDLKTDLQMETSRDMQQTAYRDARSAGRDDAPSGAYSPENIEYDETHAGHWYIEEQRVGADAIIAGLADDNEEAIDRGLHILEWGFAQEGGDGSFPGTAGGRDWQIFHSESFFVEAAAHSLLLLEASPKREKYQARLARMKPLLLRAALWLTRPDIEADGQAHNRPYTHRRYLVADALGETGLVCRNSGLIAKSVEYVRDGLSLQTPEGYNPEKGGTDSSYNAVGLVFAERYYVSVLPEAMRVPANRSLRPEMSSMLRKGVAWEVTCINPDGTISTTGNTRVGGGGSENGRNGKTKKVAKSQVYRCLFFWDYLSGENTYEELALEVARTPEKS